MDAVPVLEEVEAAFARLIAEAEEYADEPFPHWLLRVAEVSVDPAAEAFPNYPDMVRLRAQCEGKAKDPETQKNLETVDRIIAQIQRFAEVKHLIVAKRLCDALADPSAPLPADTHQKHAKLLEGAGLVDRAEFQHFSLLVSTPDPLGIMLRGFVLIEDALDSCFAAFLARPIDLYNELDLYLSGKVKLAHALGLISDDERAFFSALNTIRNKLAHKRKPGKPRYRFTSAEERALWLQFASISSFGHRWQVYDEAQFPWSLRLMLVRVYITLLFRSGRLRQLSDISSIDETRLTRRFEQAISLFIVNRVPELATNLDLESPMKNA